MQPADDNRAMRVVGIALLVLLAFLFLYALPRYRSNVALAQQTQQLEEVRGELAASLPEAQRLRNTLPEPAPDVRAWIAAEALQGLESNLVSNDSYSNGRGSQVKLRKLTPFEATQFLTNLTRVNLVFARLSLQDWDGDGNWDLEAFVEVPSPQ